MTFQYFVTTVWTIYKKIRCTISNIFTGKKTEFRNSRCLEIAQRSQNILKTVSRLIFKNSHIS